MFRMNQLQAAYGLKFGDDNEMKLFKEYTDFEEELSRALAEVTPQLERKREDELRATGDLIAHGLTRLVLAILDQEATMYDETYLLKSA